MTDPLIVLLYSITDLNSKLLYSQLYNSGLIEEQPDQIHQRGGTYKIVAIDVAKQILRDKLMTYDPDLEVPCIIIKDPTTQQKHVLTQARMYSWVRTVLQRREKYIERNRASGGVDTTPDEQDDFMVPDYTRPPNATQPPPPTMAPHPPTMMAPPPTMMAPHPPPTMISQPSTMMAPPEPVIDPRTLPPLQQTGNMDEMRELSLERQRQINAAIASRKATERNSDRKKLSVSEILAKHQQEGSVEVSTARI